MTYPETIKKSRRFYDEYVYELIHSKFREYEDRIAVGIAGEGSDCFGYDDLISRDHDFGTGVCLWLTDADMERFGYELSAAYNELVDSAERKFFTERLRERRGVMTIHNFYSSILRIDCDTENCRMTEGQWLSLDHSCLKTAVNGEVFRDEPGVFTAFRKLLLAYYPDRVWRIRVAEKLHEYSAALQVNYARCMTRKDTVAAEICRIEGMRAAMELFFLMKREYPPYYKWTYRALKDLDTLGSFSDKIKELADTKCDPEAWEGTKYHPHRLNYKDKIISLSESIASDIVEMLLENRLTEKRDPYLESYVNEILNRRVNEL